MVVDDGAEPRGAVQAGKRWRAWLRCAKDGDGAFVAKNSGQKPEVIGESKEMNGE